MTRPRPSENADAREARPLTPEDEASIRAVFELYGMWPSRGGITEGEAMRIVPRLLATLDAVRAAGLGFTPSTTPESASAGERELDGLRELLYMIPEPDEYAYIEARVGSNNYRADTRQPQEPTRRSVGEREALDSAPVSMASEWRVTRELADLLRAALLHIESNDPPEAWRQEDWAKRARVFLAEEVAISVALGPWDAALPRPATSQESKP